MVENFSDAEYFLEKSREHKLQHFPEGTRVEVGFCPRKVSVSGRVQKKLCPTAAPRRNLTPLRMAE